jgi:RNA polymerase sigma-70 factor (ECF subfamily)
MAAGENMGIDGYAEMEIELIAKCQAGDRQAFNRLVMRYQNLVYNFLYRLAPHWDDLDDLAQEVFVKVYHSIKKLNDHSQFKSWLHRIAVSVYVDEQRRRKKRQNRFISDERLLDNQTDPDENPDQRLKRQELYKHLQEAINQLPEEFKVAIVLREIQELSYEEIAKTLKCSSGTVRSRIFRGRQLLQHKLKEEIRQD